MDMQSLIVFASGLFTDHMRMNENPDFKPVVTAAAGMHNVLVPGYNCSRGVLANICSIEDINTSAGTRFLFILSSWQGKILVDTTNLKGSV